MGTFSRTVRLDSMDGRQSAEIEALVDTGAHYTIVPAEQLRKLGVSPVDKVTLVLADGRAQEYELGEAMATVDGKTTPTWVAFGNNDAGALLGAYTLEGLRLAVDPTHGTLVPLVGHL